MRSTVFPRVLASLLLLGAAGAGLDHCGPTAADAADACCAADGPAAPPDGACASHLAPCCQPLAAEPVLPAPAVPRIPAVAAAAATEIHRALLPAFDPVRPPISSSRA
jgi:hypothetical protein